MKLRSSEIRRMSLASVFALLLFAALAGIAYFFDAFFDFLGEEEWLGASINFGAMAAMAVAMVVAWKYLGRYRPNNRATEWLQSRLRDQQSPREKFGANLWLHCYGLVGFTLLMVWLAYLVGQVFAAPDSNLGSRVRILVLFGLIGMVFSVSVIGGYRHLMRQVPDGETAGSAKRQRSSIKVRRIVAVALLLLTGSVAAVAVIVGGGSLVEVTANPSGYPTDFLMVVWAELAVGLGSAWLAYQCVRELWNTRLERLTAEPMEVVVGTVSRETQG